MVLMASVVGGADCHGNGRANGGCQCSTGKSQACREHEYIIEYNVKHASAYGTDHCGRRCTVVSCKCSECIVGHEKWSCYEDDPQVVSSKFDKSCICAEQCQCFVRDEDSDQHEWDGGQNTPGY